jgi:hypothetical protein
MRNLLLSLTIGLLALSSTACRQKQQELPSPYRDPYLEGYIDAFVSDAAAHGIAINGDKIGQLRVVKFVDSVEQQKQAYGQPSGGDELAGACTDVVVDNTLNAGIYKSGERKTWQEIWISNSITGKAPTPALVLKELMYHELGHCLLGLDHAAQAPHQIMSPNVSGDAEYLQKNWGRLLRELFTQKPTLVAGE